MATAEFSKFAGVLSAALSQHHLLLFFFFSSHFSLITEFSAFTNNLRTIQGTKDWGGGQFLLVHELFHAQFSVNNSVGWVNKHCHRSTIFLKPWITAYIFTKSQNKHTLLTRRTEIDV